MKLRIVIVGVLLCCVAQSCKVIYPNRMFQKKDYEYFRFNQQLIEEYVIQPGDEFTLEVYTRNGFELVDIISGALSRQSGNIGNEYRVTYVVNTKGFAYLPVLGDYYCVGMTERELEQRLEQEFSDKYKDPYVVLRVSNRRVFVFKGSEGAVISLNQAPTSVIEVIALAGGLNRDEKAYNIKVIRGDLSQPEIIEIDLSTIEGLRKAELMVQTNDIIFVEERWKVASTLLGELTPILALVSTILASWALIKALGN